MDFQIPPDHPGFERQVGQIRPTDRKNLKATRAEARSAQSLAAECGRGTGPLPKRIVDLATLDGTNRATRRIAGMTPKKYKKALDKAEKYLVGSQTLLDEQRSWEDSRRVPGREHERDLTVREARPEAEQLAAACLMVENAGRSDLLRRTPKFMRWTAAGLLIVDVFAQVYYFSSSVNALGSPIRMLAAGVLPAGLAAGTYIFATMSGKRANQAREFGVQLRTQEAAKARKAAILLGGLAAVGTGILGFLIASRVLSLAAQATGSTSTLWTYAAVAFTAACIAPIVSYLVEAGDAISVKRSLDRIKTGLAKDDRIRQRRADTCDQTADKALRLVDAARTGPRELIITRARNDMQSCNRKTRLVSLATGYDALPTFSPQPGQLASGITGVEPSWAPVQIQDERADHLTQAATQVIADLPNARTPSTGVPNRGTPPPGGRRPAPAGVGDPGTFDI